MGGIYPKFERAPLDPRDDNFEISNEDAQFLLHQIKDLVLHYKFEVNIIS